MKLSFIPVSWRLALLCAFFIPNWTNAQVADWADTSLYSGLEFRNIGPTRGGRATTVAGITNVPGTFFMGATGGGVWKTTDYGQSWRNVSDGYFASSSVGAIRVAPSDNKIVYAGTGSDGLRSNVIAGKGVYRSADQGKTWSFIGLEKTGHIGAVEVHPDNPDVVFVAAIGQAFEANPERGLYRTKDGGESWEKVLHISDTTGVTDVEFHPTNPDVLYATGWRGERKPWTIISGGKEGGVYKSTDGGETWNKLSQGLPQGIIGKADLAVSPADPDRVYALIEAPVGEGGLYRSDDRGESWSLVSTKKELLDRPFYYCNVDVNPQNADAVYVSATQFWRSYNGGKDWTRLRTPHGDNHEVWINPQDTSIWVQCNDGGANVTRDNGKTWSTQSNQSTAELYQVEVDDQFPYWLYAGQQDNSTIALPSVPPYNSVSGATGYWMAVGGCETGPAVPKPGNPNIVYSNCKGRFGVFDKRTGQEKNYYIGAQYMYGHNPKDLILRFQRVSPIHVSPHNPDVVYHTSQYVHKTTDDGVTWETISPDLTAFTPETQVISGAPITRDITGEEFYSTIYAIRESPLQEGLIWVGANDGPVHVTRDGGKSWTNVTPKDLGPGGRVDAVEPSPHQPGKAYISVLRYQLGDWKPYAYKTEDYGQSWTLLTDGENGIPADFPVRVVREDPEREGLLYAGTEYGLFISFDDGASWQPLQQNLPITPISDIKVQRGDLVLSTMGRGFWIMDNISALHQLSAELAENKVQLFDPADQYRLRHRSSRGDEAPEYPSPRVLIDYYLSEAPAGEITLEFLDADKQVVRAFTSTKPAKETDAEDQEPSMATGLYEPGFSADLKTSPGLHRFEWDMRHHGPWDDNAQRSGRGGPMVAPGEYFVRLKVDDLSFTNSFNLLIDPRVQKTGVSAGDLRAQEQLTLVVVELESQAKRLLAAVKAEQKTIAEEVEKEKRKALRKQEQLQELEAQLDTPEGRYRQPMLTAQIRYLRGMLEGADQRPGKDAVARYETLKKEFNELVKQWQDVMGEDTELKPLD